MGPYIDSASWASLQQLAGPCSNAFKIAASVLPVAEITVRQIGWGLGLGMGGLVLGGGSLLASHRRKLASIVAAGDKAVKQHRDSFLAAAEGSLDAFYILDSVRDSNGAIVEFSFRYLNPVAEQRFKCNIGSLIGKPFRDRMSGIVDDARFQTYCEVVETGLPLVAEFPVSKPGTKISWLRHQVVKLGDGIAVTSSDLSEIRSVQDRFKRITEFSDLIFDRAPFSIIATDAKGIITAMNLEAQELTGYRSDELINKSSLLVLHDPEELRQRAAQVNAEQGTCLAGLELIAGPFNCEPGSGHHTTRTRDRSGERVQEQEWTFIRKDGTRVPVSLTVKVLWGATGERTGLIGIAYDTSKRKDSTGPASLVATHDGLTGLIGSSLLEDRISQAIKRSKRSGTKVAVLTIDLDHFKRINDALGNRVGDEILTVAANRLVAKLRISDTVARTGGDEFIVVISDQTKVSDVEFCAEQLLRSISKPYTVQGHTINVTASVGICLYPDLAGDTEHLLRRSDAAVYASKEAGRHRVTLFGAGMLEDASSRLSMEGALRQALDRNQLFIEYQPQVALPSGKVIGMEALLRWRHPRFGLVSPAQFIPMAEKIGLLPDFGTWAMHSACRDAKWIQDQLGRRVSLSVNLSPNQFEQKKLLRSMEDALRDSGLPAADLEIEIIENTLMINSTTNLETLQKMRDLGVQLSIDDFGTGFCNFNYLLQYQVDRLKIDQSFVRQAATDMNAASVVRTVIAMSHGLGVQVIAEGVETREQLKFLMRRRCDQAQGYFFARPLSPQAFVDAVPGIEAMNLSDPSGEHAAARIAAEEKIEFVRPNDAAAHRPLSLI